MIVSDAEGRREIADRVAEEGGQRRRQTGEELGDLGLSVRVLDEDADDAGGEQRERDDREQRVERDPGGEQSPRRTGRSGRSRPGCGSPAGPRAPAVRSVGAA
jgi:hypothetical protein